jgi:small basic protein
MPRTPADTVSAFIRAGSESGTQRVIGAATVRRLVAYYSLVVALVILVDLALPVDPSGKVRILAPWLERLTFGTVTGTGALPAWLETILAMAAAFLLTLPTVIVYVRTRSDEAYDDSLVNTVLVLPSIVAAILVVVQSSLALAFSLTGIVAAVRFRSNVKDSRDALYIFAGVAIGFATGSHAPDVAIVASLLFVLLELFAWRSGLGGDRAHAHAFLWGESPAEAAPAIAVEEPPVPAVTGNEHAKAHRDLLLSVEATDVDDGMRMVERVLGVTAKKWSFHRTRMNGGKTVILEYHARLRRRYTPEAVRTRLLHLGTPFVRAAEWGGSSRKREEVARALKPQ